MGFPSGRKRVLIGSINPPLMAQPKCDPKISPVEMKVVGFTRLRVCIVCKTAVYLKITHRKLPVKVTFAQTFYTPPITVYVGKKKENDFD